MTAPLDSTASDAAVELAQAPPAGAATGTQITARIPPDCVRTDLRVELDAGNRYMLPQVSGVGALRKMIVGNDVVVSTRGLGALVLDEFVTAARSGRPPALVLADGTVLTAEQVLQLPNRAIAVDACQPQQTAEQAATELAQIAPAAGPNPAALAAIAPAAGPAAGDGPVNPLADANARFQSRFTPSDFGGLNYNPVDPLTYNRGVPDIPPGPGQEQEPPEANNQPPGENPPPPPPPPPPGSLVLQLSGGIGKEDFGLDPSNGVAPVGPPASGFIKSPIDVVTPAGATAEVTRIVLTGVPAGVTFNTGLPGPTPGTWVIDRLPGESKADFYERIGGSTLTMMTMPSESDKDFQILVTGTVVDQGVPQPDITAVMNVVIDAVVDRPEIVAPTYDRVVVDTFFGPVVNAGSQYSQGVVNPAGEIRAVTQAGAWSATGGESPDDGSETITLGVGKGAGQPATIAVDGTNPNAIVLNISGGAAGFSGTQVTVTGTATATETGVDGPDNPADNTVSVSIDRTIDIAYRPIVQAIGVASAGGGSVQSYAQSGGGVPTFVAPVGDAQTLLNEETVNHQAQAGVTNSNLLTAAVTPLEVNFKGEGAGYQNMVGWYKVVNGTIQDVQIIWTDASAVNSGTFNPLDVNNPGFMVNDIWGNAQDSLVQLGNVAAGTQLGFFLVRDAISDPAILAALQSAYGSIDDLNANGNLRFVVGPDGFLRLGFDSDGAGPSNTVTVIGDWHNVWFSHDPALDDDSAAFGSSHWANFQTNPNDGLLYLGVEDKSVDDNTDRDFNDLIFSVNMNTPPQTTTQVQDGNNIVLDPTIRLADADNAGQGNISTLVFTLDGAKAGDVLTSISGGALTALGLQSTLVQSDTNADGVNDRMVLSFSQIDPGATIDAQVWHNVAQSIRVEVPPTGVSGDRTFSVQVGDKDGLSFLETGADNVLTATINNTIRISQGSIDFTGFAKAGGDYAAGPLAPIDNVGVIDMSGNANNNSVTIGLADVLALTDNPALTLRIEGDVGDALNLKDTATGTWTQSAGPDAQHDTWSFVDGGTPMASIVVDKDVNTQHSI